MNWLVLYTFSTVSAMTLGDCENLAVGQEEMLVSPR